MNEDKKNEDRRAKIKQLIEDLFYSALAMILLFGMLWVLSLLKR